MASNLSGQAEIEWTARRILLAILTVLGVVIAFALLYRFYMVVFLFFIAFSLKVAFDPFVNWLKRQGVRREVSLILLYTVLATLLLFLIWMIAPALIEQTQIVVEQLPSLYSSIRNALIAQPIGLVRGVGLVLPSEISLPELAALTPDSEQESAPWVTLSSMMWAFFAFVSVFVMAYFWTLEGDLILRRLLLRAPATRREELRILIAEIQGKISGYFRGQLILCSSIGVASTIAFFSDRSSQSPSVGIADGYIRGGADCWAGAWGNPCAFDGCFIGARKDAVGGRRSCRHSGGGKQPACAESDG